MNTEPNRIVSASEIAAWAWCPESWRLEALGEEPDNQTALARGEALHAEKSAFEVFSRRAMSAGVWLLALALLAAALRLAFFGGGG